MQNNIYAPETAFLDYQEDFRSTRLYEEQKNEARKDLELSTVAFSTPIRNESDLKLDIQSYLIKKPSSTFFMKAGDNDLRKWGIHRGDLLVVDRSLPITDKSIVVVSLDGELLIKKILISKHITYLTPWNTRSTLYRITPENDFEIWGVVAYNIHEL